jgi:hypothetical protein
VILVRCPSCFTFCDVESDLQCFGCGKPISRQLPPLKRHRPGVLEDAGRDTTAFRGLLILLAIFGVIGASAVTKDSSPLLSLALICIGILGTILSVRYKGSAAGVLGHAIVSLFALAGLMVVMGFGLVVLVFIACAAGFMR